ncbi:hypothetical protein [Helicobacter pylori]|uniref:hypothetical protein n=1 Tax=Helicobacter pylori TaxID=210 RepID=UPI000EAD0A26|nr:hypothetical protein [Helicobacter pylori]RKV61832.1 hypothetical protein DD779_04375 [Helicobacter pylori]
MKNTNLIKHFRNVESKKRLAFKKAKKRSLELLKNRGYMDFIVKVKSKQRSDDAILEILELSYLKI